MRKKIWYNLVDCKTNEYYSSYVVRYYQWAEWITNSFLVITTSSSIAAWVIWKDLYILWAFIFGLSQVVMLLKPFLLFPKYIKIYNEKNISYQYLSWDLEKLWYEYENNKIGENKAFEKFEKIRMNLIENDKFPDEVIMITHENALVKAENKFNQFLNQL